MGGTAGSADALPQTAVVPATCTSMRSGTAIFYIGLFGNDYGSENAGVVSPAGREFDLAAAESSTSGAGTTPPATRRCVRSSAERRADLIRKHAEVHSASWKR